MTIWQEREGSSEKPIEWFYNLLAKHGFTPDVLELIDGMCQAVANGITFRLRRDSIEAIGHIPADIMLAIMQVSHPKQDGCKTPTSRFDRLYMGPSEIVMRSPEAIDDLRQLLNNKSHKRKTKR